MIELNENLRLIECDNDGPTVALMLHPLGFFLFPLNISLYKLMLLLLMASSNVIVIIIGTFLAGKSPGIVVPSSLQKQSGKTQTAGSQAGAEFGSLSMSKWENLMKKLLIWKIKIYRKYFHQSRRYNPFHRCRKVHVQCNFRHHMQDIHLDRVVRLSPTAVSLFSLCS